MPAYVFATELGSCRLEWSEGGRVTSCRLLAGRAPRAGATAELPTWVRELASRVQAHLAGRIQDFQRAPLDWAQVTDFQHAVYLRAQAVSPGTTASYGQIARELAMGRGAARAVGAALAANPWLILVPCHRIVSSSGKLTGFSAPGGVRTKARLLALEGAELPVG